MVDWKAEWVKNISYTPLLKAAYEGDLKTLEKLLGNRNVDVNQIGHGRATALTVAAAGNQLEALRLLLDHGADVNKPGQWGNTALIATTSLECCKLLIERGADITRCGYRGQMTAEHAAKESGHKEKEQYLKALRLKSEGRKPPLAHRILKGFGL